MDASKRKRKYNASYRLRKKIGEADFPSKSKIMYTDIDNDLTTISEVKILTKEFGFIIQPLFFRK